MLGLIKITVTILFLLQSLVAAADSFEKNSPNSLAPTGPKAYVEENTNEAEPASVPDKTLADIASSDDRASWDELWE